MRWTLAFLGIVAVAGVALWFVGAPLPRDDYADRCRNAGAA